MAATRTRRGTLAVLLVVAIAAAAVADRATLRLRDGRLLTGDVELHPDRILLRNVLGQVELARGEVAEINWLKPAFDARGRLMRRLSQLAVDDINGHVELAREALAEDLPELARELLDHALALAPSDEAARQLAGELPSASTAPASAPALEPQIVPTPPLLSERDITHIKLCEMRLDGPPEKMRVRFLRESGEEALPIQVYREYARDPRMDSSLERRLLRGSLGEQLQAIVTLSDLRYASRISIRGNPAALQTFRQIVLPRIDSTCGRTGCHGPREARVFSLPLRSRTREPNIYTTFALLDRMYTPVGAMIDREAPEESALLKYLLPQRGENRVHPPVDKRRTGGALRGTRDPRYRAIAEWIASLRRPHPDYELEYRWPDWMKRFTAPPDSSPTTEAPRPPAGD